MIIDFTVLLLLAKPPILPEIEPISCEELKQYIRKGSDEDTWKYIPKMKRGK